MFKRQLKSKSLSHFSRWSRKSFSVFSSLNRIIKICCLLIAVVISITPANIIAQTDTTGTELTNYYLEETEVVAQRSVTVDGNLAKVVTVVTREEIAAAPFQNIQDVLSSIVNVDVRQRGKNDIQADLSIRGGTFDQTLILLNGIPINDPQTGHHNLNLPIDLSQIERIEILNGPGSRANGPNAYSGAINFVTQQASKNQVDLKLSGGQNGLMKVGTGISYIQKKTKHFVSVNYDKTNGYTSNTDFKRLNAFYSGSQRIRNSSLKWQAGYTDKSFGANSFYSPAYPNQYEQTRNLFSSLNFKTILKDFGVKTSIYYRGHADRFELFRDFEESASWYKNHNYHWSNSAGLNTNISYYSDAGIFTLGYDYRFENILSNVLGDQEIDSVQAYFDKEGFYTKTSERINSGVFFEYLYHRENFRVVTGVLANFNSMYSNNVGWNPGVDMSYRLNDYTLFLGVNKSMRIPTFTDLYYQGPTNLGNSDLIPEESLTYDFGAKYLSSNFSIQTSIYHNRGKNIIDWVKELDADKWQPMNHTKINNSGIELSLNMQPFIRTSNGKFLVESLKFSYSYNDLTKSSKDYISKYVLDYMKHKASLSLTHPIVKDIYGSWTWVWHDRAGTYTKYDVCSPEDAELEYPLFNLLDLRVYWKHNQWFVFGDVSNLLNVDYVDFGNIEQPGRWISLGVSYSLGMK